MKTAFNLAGEMSVEVLLRLAIAWPFMWIWNYSVVAAVEAKPIGYWQAFWLIMFISAFVFSLRLGGNTARDGRSG